jgi:dihydroorotate dehydrogenase (NAD+) catalytic subunit
MPKIDLSFDPPLMNAAGSLGYAPNRRGPVDLGKLGAFVTNPVSLRPRTPAQGPRLLDFQGGFLLHSGHPNPGLRRVIQRHAAQWGRALLPVVVHLLAESPAEVRLMAERLERVEGVAGVEVGLPPGCDPGTVVDMVRAAQGELPVIARLQLEQAGPLAMELANSGVAALSLAPPRGALPSAGGGLVHGRLYGPAVLPGALNAVREASRSGLPVIGAGGVYGRSDMEAMFAAGAAAVQLDAVLWRGDLETLIGKAVSVRARS